MLTVSLTIRQRVIILNQRLKHVHFGFYRRGVAFANSNHPVNSRFLSWPDDLLQDKTQVARPLAGYC